MQTAKESKISFPLRNILLPFRQARTKQPPCREESTLSVATEMWDSLQQRAKIERPSTNHRCEHTYPPATFHRLLTSHRETNSYDPITQRSGRWNIRSLIDITSRNSLLAWAQHCCLRVAVQQPREERNETLNCTILPQHTQKTKTRKKKNITMSRVDVPSRFQVYTDSKDEMPSDCCRLAHSHFRRAFPMPLESNVHSSDSTLSMTYESLTSIDVHAELIRAKCLTTRRTKFFSL